MHVPDYYSSHQIDYNNYNHNQNHNHNQNQNHNHNHNHKHNQAMILICISLCSVMFMIIIILRRWKCVKDLNDLPPGSLGWPLIGESLKFLEPHSATSRGLFMDTHCLRYGNVFKSCLFGQPSIISADPDLNKFILQNEKLFECNYPNSINAILGDNSMLVLVGEAHKRMRGIALSFMNSTKLKALFLDDVERNVLLSLGAWQDGAIFSAQEEARKFTFNLIAKQIVSFNPGEDQTIALMKDYYTFMKGVVSMPINFPGTAYNKALESRKRILRRLENEMMVRQNQCHVEEGVDLLSMVTREGNLTREETLDLLLSMLFAGHETSSVALTLALKFLAESRVAMDELRAEHVAIRSSKKSNEKLNWEDYKKMKFTQCVINETLRLGNVVQFVHRKAIQDVRFKNYMIPKGWQVLPIFSAVHLDPHVYKRPLVFHPWRWQKMERNLYFTPFGGGPRLCAGANLARLEIAIFLHHMSFNFKWKLAEEDRALASPFVQFEKGLPIHVYRCTCNSVQHSQLHHCGFHKG